MDDNNEGPCDCCCGMDINASGFTVTVGSMEADCEFSMCGDAGCVLEPADLPLDPFAYVLGSIVNSFAGQLGPGIRRVVVSEPTPDGPITHLDKSVDGDKTPPSMKDLIEE